MISAILSFLGGSAFRMVWGEFSSWMNKKQDHAHELERLKLAEQHDAAQHARQLESLKFQAEQQVKVIQVQAEASLAQLDAEIFKHGVLATTVITGVRWIDGWNAAIRPGVATWAIGMLSLEAFALLSISEGTGSVCYAALGLYLADRTLAKRGK